MKILNSNLASLHFGFQVGVSRYSFNCFFLSWAPSPSSSSPPRARLFSLLLSACGVFCRIRILSNICQSALFNSLGVFHLSTHLNFQSYTLKRHHIYILLCRERDLVLLPAFGWFYSRESGQASSLIVGPLLVLLDVRINLFTDFFSTQ